MSKQILIGLVYLRSKFLRFVQTSCNMPLRDTVIGRDTPRCNSILPVISKTKFPPERSSSSKGVRKTHCSLENPSPTNARVYVILRQLCTSFSPPRLLFVSLRPLSVLFFTFFLFLSASPSSTSLLCVSGKACLINDTRHRVSSEGWVSDK